MTWEMGIPANPTWPTPASGRVLGDLAITYRVSRLQRRDYLIPILMTAGKRLSDAVSGTTSGLFDADWFLQNTEYFDPWNWT